MRNLLALLFLSFSLASYSQSLVDSIHVSLTSFCGMLDVEVTGWYNGSDPAYLGHAIWGGYAPISWDEGFEIQPGYFNVSLSADINLGPWYPIYGSGYCGGFQATCYDELGLVLASGPDWWWYCPEESPSEVLWSFDYSPMILGTQLGLDENGNPIDLNTTDLGPPCGPGTVWDSSLELCVPDNSFPLAPCGAGTVWDPVNEECIIAVPTDSDFDGCVTPSDLLNLLATFGSCPPIPEWPDEPNDTTWTCGDPVTYWDYDYATVLIGDQCWFAENLRTTHYANGDSIPAGLTDGEWTSTFIGASAVFGEGMSECNANSPDIDACDESQSLSEFGRLYNWYAVDDARSLCSAGWHVPTDGEWTQLEDYITSQGFSGTEGIALKSTTGWYNNGIGTDNFGFSALPGGTRLYDSGYSYYAGGDGVWWSMSPNGGNAWYRYLVYYDTSIGRTSNDPRWGFSVRCIKD